MEVLTATSSEKLKETDVEIFVAEFKKKLNSIGKVDIIDYGYNNDIQTRNWLLLDELSAFYEFQIVDNNTMEVTYLETLNCDLDYDFDNRMTTVSIAKIPGFGKYIVLDIIEHAKLKGLDSIKFTNILSQSEHFYKKVGTYATSNKLISVVLYEKYIDPIGEERENIIFRL